MRINCKSVDEYIESFPIEIQQLLRKVRETIKKSAPDSIETISYGMPAYKLYGKPLVYFAGYERHIGFYATSSGHSKFTRELSKYKQGKGSVQFPLDQPVPLDLISGITKFRAEENERRAKK